MTTGQQTHGSPGFTTQWMSNSKVWVKKVSIRVNFKCNTAILFFSNQYFSQLREGENRTIRMVGQIGIFSLPYLTKPKQT